MQNVDDATDKSAEKVLFARSFLSGSMCLAIKLGFHEWHSRLFWNDYRINESRIGFRRQKRMDFDDNFWNCENKVLVIFDFWKPRQFFSQNLNPTCHLQTTGMSQQFVWISHLVTINRSNRFSTPSDFFAMEKLLSNEWSGVCKKKKIFGDYTFEL